MRRASGTTLNEPKGFDVITILREVTMNRLIIAAMCLAGGLALADESVETQTEGPIEEMQIRLAAMEQINVTADWSMPRRLRMREQRNRRRSEGADSRQIKLADVFRKKYIRHLFSYELTTWFLSTTSA
jgi:hypothetical protein